MRDLSVFFVYALVLIPFVWLSLPVSAYFVGRDPVIAGCIVSSGLGGSIIVDGLFTVGASEIVPFAALSSLAHMLAAALCFACAFTSETDAQHAQRVAARMAADAQQCDDIPQEFTSINPLSVIGVACIDAVQPIVIWVRVLWYTWRPARHSPQHAAI